MAAATAKGLVVQQQILPHPGIHRREAPAFSRWGKPGVCRQLWVKIQSGHPFIGFKIAFNKNLSNEIIGSLKLNL
jgi:hypothetical protein